MHEDKTLVPILCMHRSGSSLTTNVLAELGMSLGHFTLMAASEYNRHGHFESLPFYELNRQVQQLALGFSEEMPDSPEALQQFTESEGRWPDGVDLPPEWLGRGRELVEQLAASGAVSGFKDPRVPLLWPFWVEVFRRLPGLRVVPVVLLRSPHEIAMSIFIRSKGRFDYCDALDVAAVHYQRMHAIMADWPGPLARVRFLPEYFAEDLRAACGLVGLKWRKEVFARVFDVECKHHEAAAVAHPAQAIFEQLAELPLQEFTRENAARIECDALLRQRLWRRKQADTEAELAASRRALATAHAEFSASQAEVQRLAAALTAKVAEVQRLAAGLTANEAEVQRLAAALTANEAEVQRLAAALTATQSEAKRWWVELQLTKASRFWRLRKFLVSLPGLKHLAMRPLPAAHAPSADCDPEGTPMPFCQSNTEEPRSWTRAAG